MDGDAGAQLPAEVFETHISTVVLLGDRALKFPKAIRTPFLDQSTPELRRSGNQYIPPLNHYRRTQTDSDGRFEFKVGPGRFMLRGSRNGGPQQFTVKDEPSLEFNFQLERPDRGPLALQVVPGKTTTGANVGSAVAEVRVQEQWWTPDTGVADGDGKLTFERRLAKGFLLVRTADQKFATVQELTPDTSSLKVEVEPCGELTGRLMNGVSGKPLKDTDFSYGIQPDLGMTLYAGLGFGGGGVRTDAEGRFTGSLTIDGYPEVSDDGQSFLDDGSRAMLTFRDASGAVVNQIMPNGSPAGPGVQAVRMGVGLPGLVENGTIATPES